MLILLVEAAKNIEDEVPVRDRAVKIAEGVRHRLHLAAVLSHREITLDEVAKHGVEVKGTCLAVADELVLERQPGLMRRDAMFPGDVLKVNVDGAENPGDDNAVHPFPGWIVGRRSVEEDMGGGQDHGGGQP
ncbi:Nudix hydrolase 14 chloroplastic [Zea mays]|uniref:Nudix hydrolase 14 chloroplastic n=1 Tax=Zea mays TaxID=4577 RepID=A0A1D6NW98_MAIZE|nr:Nudix hydrolase 14 chloroplastic [Zea mays]